MLTHSNLLYQLNNLKHFLQPLPGESSLSLLPPWHIYERSCGYFIYSCGMKQVYTNIRRFREDLTKFPPQFFVCVPLVIDTLQTKVRAAPRSCLCLMLVMIHDILLPLEICQNSANK